MVQQRVGPAQRAGRPAFNLVVSKLRRAPTRAGTVPRSSLIDRLTREDSRPIVSVVAPAGYGKTTLLAQWAERNGQAFAWVSVDEADNDPKVLLSYVAAALDRVQPVGERVFEALASPVSSVPGSVVPRLGSAFWSMTTPVALVLDDVHLLRNQECRSALSVLADHVPGGSRLVLAGRDEPPLRIARLRAEDRLLEIGSGDLALSRQEAAALLRAAAVTLGGDDVAALHRRTEGWPAGLYLAALYLREGGPVGTAAVSFGGDDRLVSQYMEAEFLARISRRHRAFLTRTAVLERMCGSLCEAVLELPHTAAVLSELARSNLLLVPLDRRGKWYRYHHLFRDMLLAELERVEPGLLPVLRLPRGRLVPAQRPARGSAGVLHGRRGRRRGGPPHVDSSRCRPCGRPGSPLSSGGSGGWTTEAGSRDIRWPPSGPRSPPWRWGGQLRPSYGPMRSIAGSTGTHHGPMTHLPKRGPPYSGPSCADAGSSRCVRTPMRPCGDSRRQAPCCRWRALLQGLALILSGDPEGGDACFERVISDGKEFVPNVLTAALCERSLLAIERGEWSRAEAFTSQAGAVMRRAGIEDALVHAVAARVALHRGDATAARQGLIGAQRSRSLLTYAQPHLAVQARIELGRVHLALGDLAGARTLTGEINELLGRRPGLGTLVGEAAALRARLAQERSAATPGASALTAAELRLLPLLSTHLSVPEVAAEIYLSPHTIKSEMRSIYRKLGVSSRNQAVMRARELGLLEG